MAEGTCDEKQRSESGHGCQDTNGDRTKNTLDTTKSCGGSQFRSLLFSNNVLANDDGIVHNNAKHDDQCKQRDHVDIDPKGRKEKQGTKKRNRHSHGDPGSQAQIQHDHQKEKHHGEPENAIADE